MRRLLLLACSLLLGATAVSAEIGALCLFSDESGSECSIVDNGGLVQVYIVHVYADGAIASQFKLDVSTTGWTHLGDTWNFATVIGNSTQGVSIGYGGCMTSPFTVGSVQFTGSSEGPGTAIQIVPHPSTGHVDIVDCNEMTKIGAGGTAYVNSATPCVCETNQTPTLRVNPTSLDFGYVYDTRPVTIANIGGGTLSWSVSHSLPWLDVTPASGTNTQEVTFAVNRAGVAPGTHTGTVQVNSNAGSASIPVYMTVLPTEPVLEVQPAELTFQIDQTQQSLIVRNVGVGELGWSISSDQPWLTAAPASGVNDTEVIVQIDRTGLPGGPNYGNLMVSSNGGTATVPVTVWVAAPALSVSPTALTFATHEVLKSLTVSNSGTGTLHWSVSSDQTWLSAAPTSGVNGALVSVAVSRTGMTEGTYYGNLFFTSDGGDVTVPVTMMVPSPDPVLLVSPTSLAFGMLTTVKSLDISNGGLDDLIWNIASDQPWLTTTPSSGVNTGQVSVQVDRTGLSPGSYSGNLSVTSNGGDVNVPVTMEVYEPTDEAGAICIFSDQYASNCNIVDNGSLVPVYLFHMNTDGASASEFRLDVSSTGWIWLGESWVFPIHIGDSQNGVSIAYGQCLTSPIQLGIVYFFGANAPVGTPINVLPHPSTGVIQVVDCQGNAMDGAGGTAFVNSAIPCICGSNPDPLLFVSTTNLDFGDVAGTKQFYIANGGGGTLTWNLSESIPWLDVTPTSGTNYAPITVTVDRTGLPVGVYAGEIFVTSNAGGETITVSMNVPSQEPVLGVSPASLTFNLTEYQKQLTVFNAGTGMLEWEIASDQPWLVTDPTSGSVVGSAAVSVYVNRAGLDGGTYYGNLLVTSNGGDATVPVTMLVPVPEPALAVSPSSLSFGSAEGDKPLDVYNTGTGVLDWSIGSDQTWLSVLPAAGTGDAQVTVHVDRTGLADGPYQGNLSVTSNGGDATVPVDMWVGPQPFLSVDPTLLIFTPDILTLDFSIVNTGAGSLEWSLTADVAWIDMVPLSGTNDAVVTVTVDPATVPPGTYRIGHITVDSNAGTESIEVRFVRGGTAQAGYIGVFADEAGTNCNITDTGALVRVHFVHALHSGATAAQFMLDVGPAGWTFLADWWDFPTVIGSSVTGVSIGYGACLAAPTYLGYANFFGSAAPACRVISILPDPTAPSGQLEAVDCAQNKTFPEGHIAVVNPNQYCDCNASTGVPVQETTWGRIKAMYATEKE